MIITAKGGRALWPGLKLALNRRLNWRCSASQVHSHIMSRHIMATWTLTLRMIGWTARRVLLTPTAMLWL